MKLGLVLEIAIVLGGVGPPAHAETKRVRVPVSALPFQKTAIEIAAKDAVLPDGARDGSVAPKTWKIVATDSFGANEFAHCTDGRRGSVYTAAYEGETSTEKIWEVNGRVYFDRARVKLEAGKVRVLSAERVPVVYVGDAIWAYRNASGVTLVLARDRGMFAKATFYGCSVDEQVVPFNAASMFASDPEEASDVMNRMIASSGEGHTRQRPARWQGVAFSVLASVSKATADAEAMLNVVIKQP